MGTGEFNAGGNPAMDWHPIQGGVEIFLVASCHGNRDKLRPDGPLGSYADFTYQYVQHITIHFSQVKRIILAPMFLQQKYDTNIISKDIVQTGVNNTSHPENFMELI